MTRTLPKHLAAQFGFATFFAVMVLLNALPAIGQTSESDEPQDNQTADQNEPQIPAALTRYKGRRIAQTMHYTGAEWLIRNVREREERCSLMLANLGVRIGHTVCDMGCGNGFHSLPIAKMVGEKGLVIGVDVQPEMLSFLRTRMEKQGIENVVPILGSFHNPHLPPDTNDIVLMVDVYHEFSHPVQMLDSIRKSLKPKGLVVLVEYREEDPDVPIKPLHKMSKAQINKEMKANSFQLVKEYDLLPWQHMMFFGKDDVDFTDKKKDDPQAANENTPQAPSKADSKQADDKGKRNA